MPAADNGLGLFLTALPGQLAIDVAARAERAGFRSCWFPEDAFADAFGPATAAALRTKRVGIGAGVVGIRSRSVVTTALQAATLHRLSGGRLLLGLGADDVPDGEPGDPVEAMRDTVTILRGVLAGRLTSHEGEVFSVENFYLDMPVPQPAPRIAIAANDPAMIELAGEIADGLVGWFQSLEYVRDVTMPALRRGAERAGRSLDGFEATVGFPTVVTRDDSGVELAQGQVMMVASANGTTAYRESARAAGFGAEADAIAERVRAGDLHGAVAEVPDEMAAALAMAGSPDRVRARIDAYRAAGVTGVHLLPSQPGGFHPLSEDHFPAESLSQVPELDVPALLRGFDDTIELLGTRHRRKRFLRT